MKLIMMFVLSFSLLELVGCNTLQNNDSAYTGSGTDQLPVSPCVHCDKEPFYKAGRWLN